jgi:hypothetical protein
MTKDQRRADALCDRVTGATGAKAVARCDRCGRVLTSQASVSKGRGPECAHPNKPKRR